ncbi:helicase-related protein [Planomonospora parontospora]|uniref:helicase-related protein n=1 Tax=Planomonospora parontospora TaxID=58119 RepID=UPI00166FC1D7|nr:helicase-related protein [Planomonospora parontospora]GGL56802.1 RNA helicase [Planomonospora parontospora subsp. antibiotica]GII19983.1 RNA helicase [Planomonospora parontospora subsp. antibiotica]
MTGVRLEDLTPGAVVGGVVPDRDVSVVAVKWYGTGAVDLTYRTGDGRTAAQLLYREHEPRLSVRRASAAYAFDGDGAAFKLAAEALRLRMAARFDPMLAVTSSDLEPLPHQIQAVYGELLDRTPLRFVLADDPGAGKTIMAGLYIKELMLRGDLERCMIVAPGGLVEQWQEELLDKFGLRFELLTRQLLDAQVDRDVFADHPLLIARMDQLSRSEELQIQLERSDWDLVVVDEAHRMSARYFGDELKKTKRYQLGELLGRHARHLLLMTATPHAGNEADFQLFMGLLDSDRFEGKYREGISSADTDGLMRRMVKEDLLTFEGRPLFPERRAYTVPYELSDAERDLYEAVTEYVREQMGRAQQLAAQGEGRRGNTVGFALTVLQRRLASSPEAILQSLVRRHQRLTQLRHELVTGGSPMEGKLKERLAGLLGKAPEDLDADLDDLPSGEVEELEDDVVDAATTAQTVAELDKELGLLADLTEVARRVRHSGTDRKWTELSELLQGNTLVRGDDGAPRKLIVFTEHKDTLEYLVERLRGLIGREEAVVAIHGGVSRDQRRRVKEVFTQDRECRVLVATDAAGEGLNLQQAHLMVNYDLPWNPNRIEQRFGRIHRIGQTEVCHLWNLVAADTREGAVFQRLLDKIEEQRRAYKGKVFDVLGEAFQGEPLRRLLMEAIQYGDRPEVRNRLNQVIDASVGEGLDRLLAERALAHQRLGEADVAQWRLRMEEAQARRLQPHYVRAFFLAAFRRLGGRVSERETGRYEITHVPGDLLAHDRQIRAGVPVLRAYTRVTFDRGLVRVPGRPQADLLAPGHPLLDAVVSLVIERYGTQLKQGAVLVDRRDPGEEPHLLVAVAQEVADGHDRIIGKRFDFVEVGPSASRTAGAAPYLDYLPATEEERRLTAGVLTEEWLAGGVEDLAVGWAVEHGLAAYLDELRGHVTEQTARTRSLVRQRLLQEINYWDIRHADLLDAEQSGKKLKIRPETAQRRARDLEARLERRMADLDRAERLQIRPPLVAGAALVVPQGLLDRLAGLRDGAAEGYAKETAEVERRAVERVLAEERRLGRLPEEMAHNNPGYDIRSRTADDHWVFLEVKGRIAGAQDFHVTRTEVLTGKNSGQSFRLALVSVHPDGPEHDEVRYLVDPFRDVDFGDFAATDLVGDWNKEWARGGAPA